MARMPVYAVTYTYVAEPERLASVRAEHRAYLRGLHADGAVLASGPLPDDGGALLLLSARDLAGLEQLLLADPFAVHGLISATDVRRWDPVIGPWAS
ncbi:hypothetical protein GCM10011331_18140 [Flavimobilis marinus]|uniref:YCII-related domain-containing protein n=1 Tax=Flavimobilis marinus TaxID=285351 RepID=A0A1I2F6S5_9MICO|nr:YciI family protein [Flavimobilis marinus]GHG52962.1 hypothetical protein GCM10011331_18140 [Flavimobilis marinus]SFF00679.1 hypothetical protein SAMN04488035_1142 [Flavimobilis marinus]